MGSGSAHAGSGRENATANSTTPFLELIWLPAAYTSTFLHPQSIRGDIETLLVEQGDASGAPP